MAYPTFPEISQVKTPIAAARTAVNAVRSALTEVKSNGLVPLINNRWVSGNIFDCLVAISNGMSNVFNGLTSVMTALDNVQTQLDNYTNSLKAFFTLDGAIRTPQELRDAVWSWVQNLRSETWARIELRAGQYRDDAVSRATIALNNYATNVDNWANSEVRPRLNSAEARLNGIRDKAGAEWNGISAYATQAAQGWAVQGRDSAISTAAADAAAKANAALEAANQNLDTLDARLAGMIADSNGRTTDLENKLPLTTAALNKRIDEANQAATDKANAALAAANENITTVKDDLSIKTSNLDARVRKMEMEIEKVAPVLGRLPTF